MRNIFDQYKHPENRLTHALVCCLVEDQDLLKRFVRWTVGDRLPESWRLTVLEQQLPGEEEPSEEEAEERGLPDAWIHDDKSWALIIESKIAAPLSTDQLNRHRTMAQRRGFKSIFLLAITPVMVKTPIALSNVHVITWSEIYLWFKKQTESSWAKRFSSYMEEAEAKMVASKYLTEGALTVFSGIPFDERHPYTYLEAKRLLVLAMDSLRKRKDLTGQLGVDSLREGRPAITGKDYSSVWDFLWLRQAAREKNSTTFPHLTLSLNRDHAAAMITLGDGLKTSLRQRLCEEGPERFSNVISAIEARLSKAIANKGGSPTMYVVQRHFSSRRSVPVTDGRIEFDLRTFREKRKREKHNQVRPQPEWCEATFQLIAKRRSNMQIGIGAIFPYSATTGINTPQMLDLFAAAWLSSKPLLTLLGAAR
jgi:hypothetical protein